MNRTFWSSAPAACLAEVERRRERSGDGAFSPTDGGPINATPPELKRRGEKAGWRFRFPPQSIRSGAPEVHGPDSLPDLGIGGSMKPKVVGRRFAEPFAGEVTYASFRRVAYGSVETSPYRVQFMVPILFRFWNWTLPMNRPSKPRLALLELSCHRWRLLSRAASRGSWSQSVSNIWTSGLSNNAS